MAKSTKQENFSQLLRVLDQEVDYNMGIVSITRAEYDKAVSLFGECNMPNAALAKILAGDNNGALKVT
jgi:hypothetical protein